MIIPAVLHDVEIVEDAPARRVIVSPENVYFEDIYRCGVGWFE